MCAVSQIWNFCVFFICHLVQTGFIKHFKLHNCDFSSNDHILTKANVTKTNVYHFKSKVARWVFWFCLDRNWIFVPDRLEIFLRQHLPHGVVQLQQLHPVRVLSKVQRAVSPDHVANRLNERNGVWALSKYIWRLDV